MNKRLNRYTADTSSVLPNSLFWMVCLGIGAWLTLDAQQGPMVIFSPFADYWEHTAVLKEWLENFSAPANPNVDDPALSSRFMPYFWLLTVLGRALGLNAIQLMSVSAVVNFAIIAIGLRLFLQRYFRDHWAPLIGVIVIFGFWGVGWNWSNLYQLRSFFYVAGYPSSLVFGLSLISFWVTLLLLRSSSRSLPLLAVALAALAGLMFLCHPLTGVFGLVGCGLLVITDGSRLRVNQGAALAALLVGIALAELWPYFSVWKLTLGLYGAGVEGWTSPDALMSPLERLQSGVWAHIFYTPRLVITMLGLALLGVPLWLWLFIKREHPFIVYGAILMFIPYGLHLLVEIPLAHRFLLFAVTFLHFAIIWGWLQLINGWSAIPRSPLAAPALLLSLVVGAVVVAANIWLVTIEFDGRTVSTKTLKVVDKRTATPDGISVPELYSELLAPVPDDAVVLATPAVGWPLPTIKGHVVSLYHENPVLLDQAKRYKLTADFFYRPIDDLRRVRIVQMYNVHYVLLNEAETSVLPDVQAWLDRSARLIAERGSYKMYALADALHDIKLPEPEPENPSPDVSSDSAEARAKPATKPSQEAPRLPAESAEEPADEAEPETQRSFGAPIGAPIIER